MKKISTIFILALAIAGTLTLGSCKKDKSRTEIITTGNWMISSLMADMDGNGTPETDFLAAQDACDMDDYLAFFVNGTTIAYEGADVCVGEVPETPGTWSFDASETVLTYISDGVTETYSIVSISDNEIKVTGISLFGTLYITFTKH